MVLRTHRVRFSWPSVALAAGAISGCSAGDVRDGNDRVSPDVNAQVVAVGEAAGDPARCEKTFGSSFAAIQALIFERRGCTASACHGQAKLGGLDLRAEVSWENLVDVASTASRNLRIHPGATAESYLYQKLLAATRPGSVQIAGSPMPVGTPALTERELQAVALWIQKGAPKDGNVGDGKTGVDVGQLLDACLPPTKPVKIKPLEPPPPGDGVQFLLPRYALKANSELELCTPFAYDFSSQVPAAYKDEQRGVMYVSSSSLRQDPQSHHLVIWNPKLSLSSLTPDTSWTCNGGPSAGGSCNPQRGSAECGAGGVCVGKTVPGTFCNQRELPGGIDLGALSDPQKRAELLKDPAVVKALQDALTSGAGAMVGTPEMLANSNSAQEIVPAADGVYWEIPIRGVMWFNSHSFNLDDEDTVIESRLNYTFAKKREHELRQVTDSRFVFIASGQPPFTRKTYCAKYTAEQGQKLAYMISHTHRRGEHFWVNDPSGKMIYESFTYSEPVRKQFEPPLAYDSPDPAARTIEYCATYSNGLTKDDKPDLKLVTRASKMPGRAGCNPVACVAGKVTAACKTDRDCDSAPGANDGDCDACAITAGATTEDEMFSLTQWFVLPPK